MTLRKIPPLDEQIGEILDAGYSRDMAVAQVMRAVTDERDRTCLDDDCARLAPHSRLGPHAWKHEASPPFGHPFPGVWTCFTCGRPKRARIHRVSEP